MGRLVNVVLPSGRVVAVDEDVAKQGQLQSASVASQVADEANEERSSGVVEGLKAAGEGALDTATFGLYGAARGVLDPEGARTMRIRAQERAGSRLIGEVGAMAAGAALPFAGAPGLARTANTALGGGAVGRAVEGAALGVGGYISSTNVTGDPLTIEAAVEAATIGGILEVGFGVAADKLEGAVWNNEARAAKQRILAEDAKIAAKGEEIFKSTPPSWNEFVELHEARQSAVAKFNKEVAAEAEEYAEQITPRGLNGTIREFEKARNEVLAEVNRDPAVRAALDESNKARGLFERDEKLYTKLTTDDEALSVRLNAINKILKDKRRELAPREAKETIYETHKVGDVGHLDEGGRFIPKKKGSNYRTGRQKQVISEEMDAKLKNYNLQLETAMKKKAAGDLVGAVADAAKLRAEMAAHLRGRKIPRIPSKPVAPRDPDVLVGGNTAEMVAVSRELASGVENARGLMREGRYAEANTLLDGLRHNVGQKAKHLTLPDVVKPPRQPLPELKGSLPRKLDEFSRKHTDAISELANNLDTAGHEALMRVMKDLDVELKGSALDDLTALHGTLRTYRGKIKEIEALKAAAKESDGKKPAVLRWMNRTARYLGGRAVDTGGGIGGVRRVIGSEVVGRSMTAVEGAALGYAVGGDAEDAALGAALMSGRLSLRDRVRNVVTKYGVPAAGALRKLGAPTAYLSQSFVGGEKDNETDYRRLAVNRIHEIQSAAMAAPDAAFMAVQGMLGHPSDIAWKMHQHVVGSLNYLVSTLPKDPGTDTMMFRSNWTPQWHEAIALAHRLEAMNDPLTAITRAIGGDSHPAATEALWAVYPSLMNELAQELSVAAPNLKELTYEQASAYSNLFRTPLTGLQQPVVVTAIQGLYMTGPSAPPPPGPKGGKAPGRPAAVQSQAAGSNPTLLQGQ